MGDIGPERELEMRRQQFVVDLSVAVATSELEEAQRLLAHQSVFEPIEVLETMDVAARKADEQEKPELRDRWNDHIIRYLGAVATEIYPEYEDSVRAINHRIALDMIASAIGPEETARLKNMYDLQDNFPPDIEEIQDNVFTLKYFDNDHFHNGLIEAEAVRLKENEDVEHALKILNGEIAGTYDEAIALVDQESDDRLRLQKRKVLDSSIYLLVLSYAGKYTGDGGLNYALGTIDRYASSSSAKRAMRMAFDKYVYETAYRWMADEGYMKEDAQWLIHQYGSTTKRVQQMLGALNRVTG